MEKLKEPNNKILNLFGLRFELWKVVQGYRLSIDTKTTRYIFKFFSYTGKCSVDTLI